MSNLSTSRNKSYGAVGKRKPPKRLSNYKKATKLEEGLTVARLNGQARFEKTKKGFMFTLKHILLDMGKKIEPIDFLAILGTTIIVKKIIEKSEELMKEVSMIVIPKASWYFFEASGWGIVLNQFMPARRPRKSESQIQSERQQAEILLWIVSFAIAYIIVKHAGAIIQAVGQTTSSFAGLVGTLLKSSAVPA